MAVSLCLTLRLALQMKIDFPFTFTPTLISTSMETDGRAWGVAYIPFERLFDLRVLFHPIHYFLLSLSLLPFIYNIKTIKIERVMTTEAGSI